MNARMGGKLLPRPPKRLKLLNQVFPVDHGSTVRNSVKKCKGIPYRHSVAIPK